MTTTTSIEQALSVYVPIYDSAYRVHLERIREHIDPVANLHTVGRNGMHKYNNQDHSMLTAMLAARNIAGTSPMLRRNIMPAMSPGIGASSQPIGSASAKRPLASSNHTSALPAEIETTLELRGSETL